MENEMVLISLTVIIKPVAFLKAKSLVLIPAEVSQAL